jgi:hypothetical protein
MRSPIRKFCRGSGRIASFANLIRADLPEGVATIQSREGELRAALDRRIQSDFEYGRTVEL